MMTFSYRLGMLVLVLYSCGIGAATSTTASVESEKSAAVEFVRAKYAYLVSGDTDDPLAPTEADVCRSVSEVPITNVCGTRENLKGYLVEVLRRTHGSIRDVVAFGNDGDPFSLLDEGGVGNLLARRGIVCDSGEGFQRLALLQLRLIYAPEDPDWTPEHLCGTREDTKAGSCVAPSVKRVFGGFRWNVFLYAARYHSDKTWEEWNFRLRGGKYSYSVEEIGKNPQ